MKTIAGIARSLIVAATVFAAACNSGLDGTYQDDKGMMQYNFRGDGTVYVNVLGINEVAAKYRIDGDRVIVEGTGQAGGMVLKRKGDSLIGPMEIVLHRKK